MKRASEYIAVLILMCVCMLSSCSDRTITGQRNVSKESSKSIFAMDTVMTLTAYGEKSQTALDKAENEILRLDTLLRRGSPDSEIYKINVNGEGDVSEDTADIISRSSEISEMTGGALDITIAPVMDLWGFYTKEYLVPTQSELSEALARVNYRNISVNGNYVSLSSHSQIDLGAVAKGALSDRIIEIFKSDGISSAIISLGGNVHALGTKPDGDLWSVGIQHPDDDTYIGVVRVEDSAVVTSGTYQRYFEEEGRLYHHIIDPGTGYPADNGLKSVTVICKDATLADGLSTALFVMGADEGAKYWKKHGGFEAIFISESNEISITEGIEDVFKSEYDYSVITHRLV